VSPAVALNAPIVTSVDAEVAAAQWRSLEEQINQKKANLEVELESLRQLQSERESIISTYVAQERSTLLSGNKKTTQWHGLTIGYRKAADSVELNSGVTYDEVWGKVQKLEDKLPELAFAIKPRELLKKGLKDLSDKVLARLGCQRITGGDEFKIELAK
jgi:hypothetical protein